jgi:hypothetical protein
MICPVCQLEIGVERWEGELALTYNFKEWTARCLRRDKGSPALCNELKPKLLKLLTNGSP